MLRIDVEPGTEIELKAPGSLQILGKNGRKYRLVIRAPAGEFTVKQPQELDTKGDSVNNPAVRT